jgi:hypothetical protein
VLEAFCRTVTAGRFGGFQDEDSFNQRNFLAPENRQFFITSKGAFGPWTSGETSGDDGRGDRIRVLLGAEVQFILTVARPLLTLLE